MTADDGAMRAHVRERGLAADMGPGRSLAVLMLQQNAAEGIHRIEDAYTNWYLVAT